MTAVELITAMNTRIVRERPRQTQSQWHAQTQRLALQFLRENGHADIVRAIAQADERFYAHWDGK